MDSRQTSLGVDQILGMLRRRAPWVLLCAALVAGAAYGFSKHQTKKYTATAALAFNSNPLDAQIAGLSVANGTNPVTQQASNVELVRSGDAALATARLLGHGLTAERIIGALTIAGRGETSIVVVSVTTTSPALAAEIANTYTQQFVKKQQNTNRQYFKSALAIVHRQLAALSPAQRVGSDGLLLQNRSQTLSLLSELNFGGVQVAGEALTPTSPSSPKVSRNTILGVILGLLLGLGVSFLLERLDRQIRRPEDLEEIYGLPLLGAVPESAALARTLRDKQGRRTALPRADAEAFSLIRAHLRFFNVGRDLRTIVIASSEPDDGKTTIAHYLAEAATRSGSRVLLIEVDLRHPTLSKQLELPVSSGLAEVLVGIAPVGDAIQSVELEAASGEGAKGRSLDVLAAGAVLPPNPGELLESQAMHRVLEWAKWATYDLVVIDTPPLGAVSDAFPLLTKVDGVVVVGRVGHSRRDRAERLHQVLESSGAFLLGIVANGSKSDSPSPYPSDEMSHDGATVTNEASSPEDFISTA